MFKIENFEEEIYNTMEKNIVKNQNENKFQKIVKAAEYLTNAALLFEKAGMKEESKDIKNIINACIKNIKSESK